MKFNGYICDRCGKNYKPKSKSVVIDGKGYDYCPECVTEVTATKLDSESYVPRYPRIDPWEDYEPFDYWKPTIIYTTIPNTTVTSKMSGWSNKSYRDMWAGDRPFIHLASY